jgi:hypothetical protein
MCMQSSSVNLFKKLHTIEIIDQDTKKMTTPFQPFIFESDVISTTIKTLSDLTSLIQRFQSNGYTRNFVYNAVKMNVIDDIPIFKLIPPIPHSDTLGAFLLANGVIDQF